MDLSCPYVTTAFCRSQAVRACGKRDYRELRPDLVERFFIPKASELVDHRDYRKPRNLGLKKPGLE